MFKYIFLLLLLFVSLDASEYPHLFSKMGTPLFKSAKVIDNLSDIESLQKASARYVELATTTMESGFLVDDSNSNIDKKKYLFELRKLQKQHDKFLHLLHKNIDLSIKEKNYDMFFRLTSYEFDGLLKSRTLLKRSIEFYKSRKTKKKSKFLDSKITYNKLLKATASEFHTKVVKSTYSSSSKETSKKRVYISTKNSDKYITIFAHNNNPYSVTVNIKGKYKNFSYNKVKNTFSIPAGSTKEYIKLYKKRGSSSYSLSYSWMMGSMDAIHNDSYIYRLPFAKGTSMLVTQGYNGKQTHKGASKYAVDFAMDIGTKIYAARDGIVADVKEDSDRVGYSKEFAKYGNFVTIEHKDGTFATYYHLKRHGALVSVGQRVLRGDSIGYSGNTGYSSGPHLHFQVFKAMNANSIQSIPVKFISYKELVINPKRGVYYKAK